MSYFNSSFTTLISAVAISNHSNAINVLMCNVAAHPIVVEHMTKKLVAGLTRISKRDADFGK